MNPLGESINQHLRAPGFKFPQLSALDFVPNFTGNRYTSTGKEYLSLLWNPGELVRLGPSDVPLCGATEDSPQTEGLKRERPLLSESDTTYDPISQFILPGSSTVSIHFCVAKHFIFPV